MTEDPDKENRDYINKRLNPILEKIILDILISKPPNVVEFMVKWLKDNGKKVSEELQKKSKEKNFYGEESDSESDEEANETPVSSINISKTRLPGARTSVSAEVYGLWNKKGNFTPKIVKKTPDQVKRIQARILQSFLFSALEDKDLEIVINAFEEKTFPEGKTIIKQGDDGDNLYILDNGKLNCFKKIGNDDKLIKEYEPGEAFGELALLYNAPRAATIISKTKCTLFSLDRETFNHIVKEAACKKREKYEKFLSSVDLLESMDPYERTKIADALKPMKFKKNDYIVKEGDYGDSFFFLEEGLAIAEKVTQQGKPPQQVYSYKSGGYFGELALLRDTPRAASIKAETDVSVVCLDRLSFKRLLGPLEEILKRNFARYEKFLSS